MKENATGRVPVCGRGKERIEEERERVGETERVGPIVVKKKPRKERREAREKRKEEREKARAHLYLVSPVKRILITKSTAIQAGKNAHHGDKKTRVQEP